MHPGTPRYPNHPGGARVQQLELINLGRFLAGAPVADTQAFLVIVDGVALTLLVSVSAWVTVCEGSTNGWRAGPRWALTLPPLAGSRPPDPLAQLLGLVAQMPALIAQHGL